LTPWSEQPGLLRKVPGVFPEPASSPVRVDLTRFQMTDLDQGHVIGGLTLRAEDVAGVEEARLGRCQQITLLFPGQAGQQQRRRQVIPAFSLVQVSR
jgi:hypothetical protein